MITPRFLTLTTIVLLAALSRLVPHPVNFTPIAGMALFAGAHFSKRWVAFLIPILSLVLSDLVIGFYPGFLFVYGSFLLLVGIGMTLRQHRSVGRIFLTTLLGSMAFFVVTNFGDWLVRRAYPMTFDGLMTCYISALPFFRNTVASDLVTTALLFGGFALMERSFPALQDHRLASSTR